MIWFLYCATINFRCKNFFLDYLIYRKSCNLYNIRPQFLKLSLKQELQNDLIKYVCFFLLNVAFTLFSKPLYYFSV